jgi:eukaryotic-like serine/threonine-protein kinase
MTVTRLGPYQLADELGSGAWFTVRRAVGPAGTEPVVVKILHGALAERTDLADRLETVLRRSAAVRHPGLVAVHEVHRTDGLLWTVEEFVAGRSMLHLTGGPLAAPVLAAVLRALAHAHDHGLVHGCVHPGAVRLTPGGTPKLGDLGYAVADPALVGPRTFGTLDHHGDYLAPEVLAGRTPTVASDVYSVGAMVRRLLPAAAAVAARATAVEPADRYPSATALLAAIDATELR